MNKYWGFPEEEVSAPKSFERVWLSGLSANHQTERSPVGGDSCLSPFEILDTLFTYLLPV